MLPSSLEPMPRVPAERMLIARLVTAVGLALLLVVGAWSASHGAADVHGSLCLAPGASQAVGATTAGADSGDLTAVDILSSDAAVCLAAVLCGVGLVLLFRLLFGGLRLANAARAPRQASPPRAGPRMMARALTLTQLSVYRI